MEVNVLPFSIAALPHSGLFGLHGARHAIPVHVLGQSNISNACSVFPDEMHMWVQEDGVHRLISFRQCILKVEAMEVMSLYQITQGLWLKGRQTRITNFRIGFKVSIVYGLNQLFSNFYNFLFASFNIFILNGGISTFNGFLISIYGVVDHGSLGLQCRGRPSVFRAGHCVGFVVDLNAVWFLVEQTLGCLSFLLALNFFRHSTVSCLCIMEATVDR